MHAVLARPSRNPDFAPLTATGETLSLWRERFIGQLDAALAIRNLYARDRIVAAAARLFEECPGLPITRIHGDLHLGQVLVAAGDAIIIDFEGEPAKPIAERREKNSPLRDVAGMLRSFDYVGAVVQRTDRLASASRSAERAQALLQEFGTMARATFLEGYEQGRGRCLDEREKRFITLFALEKAAYEIVYEANNRPDWIDVPASGFVKLADLVAAGGA